MINLIINMKILILNKINIIIIGMINKSNYRTTNLTIIKTDWEDKDRDRKGQTLTKTLTFNFKNIWILTLFHTLAINHITLLIRSLT